ncbi:acyl-CoA dehydrogenase family protein [Aeromicrobium sp. 50.2.37]|uniref:acyl-CoA dehydrogenase family protein n=1 Tax=Aeromicrobium sp. 50.2.37 TaxID=2969305 RepID=UPI00214FEBBA|nr:acyl-CoA dehydrogenase family protein [Aeromicrobium sp. 50.2.37]MCR4514164.1 acyl-CoA dehydrogenase family protein [Aeromicrobium sp. 50.2.37]
MDFTLDSEQTALRDAVRGLLSKTYDSSETRREVTKTDPGFSEKAWQQLAELGALGLPFSEEDGGFGAGPVEVAIVAEEIGRVLAPEPYLETILAAGLVADLGSAEQRADVIGRVAEGALVLSFAHHDVDDAVVAAESGPSTGSGQAAWALTGVKEPVLHGERADLLVVTARTDAGVGVFVVDPSAGGVDRIGYRTHDGGRAARVAFDGAAATPLGDAGADAEAAVAKAVARGQIALSHEAVGAMEVALRTTTEYLKTRKQFGVTLNTFQALTFRAADLYVSAELARSIVTWATLVLQDDPDRAVEAAARAKRLVSRTGRHIGQEAIQLHGGIGMTAEYSVGHYTSRLTAIDHTLGDGSEHLLTLARSVADHGVVDPIG